eukprot:scaffold2261_cov124-Cylindrotheca_fusiformis.AAC.3
MSSVLNFQGRGEDASEDIVEPNDTGSSDDVFSNAYVEAVFCYGWVFIVFYCILCKRTRGDTRSTAVGDRIRQRAREINEQMERQKIKESQTPDERKKLVDGSLQTKRVLSKDAHGNLTLGNLKADTAIDPPSGAEKPQDHDIECGNSSTEDESSSSDPSAKNIGHSCEVDDVDEDQTCVICLDLFEKGDSVSWSRTNEACTHVFHTECIRPWLEEKRQDECPSCRSRLICYPCDQPNATEKSGKTVDAEDDADHEEGEESLFVIVHGLIAKAAMSRIQQSASNIYDLVSVNSRSFDSQDSSRSQESENGLSSSSEVVSDDEAASTSSDPTQVVEMHHSITNIPSSIRRTAEV